MGISTPPVPKSPARGAPEPTQPALPASDPTLPVPPPADATIPAGGAPTPHLGMDPRDLQGRGFGRYRLLRELGRGGMGVVWLAWDPQLRRLVALKQILHAASDEAQIERFVREARLAAKLRHPNIVAVHDSGVTEGAYYFTSEYVEGESLDVRMEKPVTPRQAATWVKAVAEALDHAHREGVVHRDVKPGNILLDARDRPYVGDFGLAKEVRVDAASGASLRTLTVSGVLLGTPGYMSPEQASARTEAIGPPSDQFSLGVVLYELLTGRAPFEGKGLQEVLNAITQVEPVRPRRWVPALHADLQTICLRAIEKDPLLRYPSLGEMAADLGRWLNGESIHARPVTFLQSAVRRVARRPALATSVCLAVAAIVGLSFYAVSTREGEEGWRREADRERAEREAAQARERKSALAQEVLGRWVGIVGDVDGLYAARTDSTIDDAECARRIDEAWKPVARFAAETAADPTSQVTMRSLVWWAGAVAGKGADIEALRRLEKDDPDVPYPAVVEAMWLFSCFLQEQPTASPRQTMTGFREGAVPAETPRARSLREQVQAALARALRAPVWGAGQAKDLRAWSGAVYLYARGEHEPAEEALGALLPLSALRCLRRDLLLARANTRIALWRLDGALKDMEEALALTPEHAPTHVLVGDAAMRLAVQRQLEGRLDPALYARAEEAYTCALTRAPDLSEPRLSRAMVRLLLGRLPGAEEDLTEYLATREDDAAAWVLRGRVRSQAGNLKGAVEDLDRAILLDPDDADALVERGPLRYQLGDKLGGREDLDRAVALAPASALAWSNRGTLRAIEGDHAGGVADYVQALAVAPANWQMRAELQKRIDLLKRR